MAAPYGSAPQERAPAPSPVAVVSLQFCAPYAVPLTVTKKAISPSGGDFVVTDANGAEMLRVNSAIFSIHDRRVLLDAAGQLAPPLHVGEGNRHTYRYGPLFFFLSFVGSIRIRSSSVGHDLMIRTVSKQASQKKRDYASIQVNYHVQSEFSDLK
jgi:hypothetical protein